MPSPRRVVEVLANRGLPLRARLDLLAADALAHRGTRGLLGVRYGSARVYLTRADYAIDRASFVFAVAEQTYATDYREKTVLDLGAHKGYFSAFAVAHGARAVVSYEPESANLAVLERTAAGYRAQGALWTIHGAAVDAAAGQADLHVLDGSWGHALDPPERFAENEVGVERVAVVALEHAIANATSLDAGGSLVVKVNIEGAECSAILGTAPGAWQDVDEVFVETHPWASCGASEIAAQLEIAGLSRIESAHPAALRMRREVPARSGRRSDPT
jgi:FkbM family methyltransferase